MQAIITKYQGPTYTKGSRVKATCDAGSITLQWDHALNTQENHEVAAAALRVKLGWGTETHGELISGQLPTGAFCHVFMPKEYVKAREAVMLTRLAISKGENNGNPHGRPWGKAITELTDNSVSPWNLEYEVRKAAMYAEGDAK